jgi:thiosulfate dehydrogenase
MRLLIIGVGVGIVLVFVGVYCYFRFGLAPVAVTAPAMPFEKMYANMALHAAIEKGAPKNAAFLPAEADLQTGAHLYREHCAVCHALPDGVRTKVSDGEFPKPPLLLKGKGVTDDPPGETYWKVKNGIRMTGMPGFGNALSDRQIWDIAFVCAQADKLPASVQTILNQPYKPDAGT